MRVAVLIHAVRRAPALTEAFDGLAPGDRAALGAAVRLADESAFEVVAVTAGPSAAEASLRRALAGGAATALRVWSADVHHDDHWAVSRVLATGLQHVGFDLIFAGDRSANWSSGMMGPAVAQQLQLPHLSGALRASYRDGELEVEHACGARSWCSRVSLPALITFCPSRDGAQRSLERAARDGNRPIALDVLDLTERNPTGKSRLVARTLHEQQASSCEMLTDAAALCARLTDLGLLR